jgi:hypothetical protein
MKCPYCEAENLYSAKFGKKCGQSLGSEAVCQHYQHHNSSDSQFCVQYGQTLSVMENGYTMSARAMGAANLRIMLRHILPNCGPPLLVLATMQIGLSIQGQEETRVRYQSHWPNEG